MGDAETQDVSVSGLLQPCCPCKAGEGADVSPTSASELRWLRGTLLEGNAGRGGPSPSGRGCLERALPCPSYDHWVRLPVGKTSTPRLAELRNEKNGASEKEGEMGTELRAHVTLGGGQGEGAGQASSCSPDPVPGPSVSAALDVFVSSACSCSKLPFT